MSERESNAPRLRAIIADDEAFIRQVLLKMLERLGVEVVGVAENGQEAVQLYRNASPDLVILDIAMPLMDGLEATRAILALDPAAKILMCTSFSGKQYVLEAVKLGAKGYVNKPFDLNKIRDKIAAVCPPSVLVN